jgi:hypothetical protein
LKFLDVFCAIENDIRKVRKRQHQDPEFGHTQGEISKKKPAKNYISIQGSGVKLRKPSIFDGSSVSPCLSFFLSASHCCYIDFHCSYVYSYYNSSGTL